jgi:hypothetical protein
VVFDRRDDAHLLDVRRRAVAVLDRELTLLGGTDAAEAAAPSFAD